MKTNILVLALIAVGFAANAFAAKPPPQPEPPQDVTVINDDTQSIPVTVQNPQTSVTVDNTSGNPVPITGSVTVDNASPIPVNVQNLPSGPSQGQFVGFSTATFNGGQGMVTYTNACQQDYPASWMCTSKEFLETKVYPATTGQGWIRPTFVPIGAATGNNINYFLVHDMSGSIASSDNPITAGMSCSGWQATTVSWVGLTVIASGKFERRGCNTDFAVACCQ